MFGRAYVEITNRCNLHCAFCPGTKRPSRDMSPAEFKTVLTKLRPLTRYLYLHVMGEPLLHPQLEALLSLAAERDFRVCLTTNGVLLSERTETLLAAPALHKVSISLHSFEGNEGGEARLLPYLNDVWDFARRAAAQGVICV
ncbi:MAG: radical SAM protein, partial [Oscillospiraceae bacterium]